MTVQSQKTAVMICAMHRSGTSILARSFSMLGYGISKSQIGINDSNKTGHWESQKLARLHDSILEAYDSEWRDWLPLQRANLPTQQLENFKRDIANCIDDEFGHNDSDIVIKDPRLCRLADSVIEGVETLGYQVKVIGIIRNPLEVVESLKKRNGLTDIHANFLWLRYVLEAEFLTREKDRYFISYEKFLNQPTQLLGKVISSLDLNPKFKLNSIGSEIDNTVDSDLRHHLFSSEEVVLNPLTRKFLAPAYAALKLLCEDPHSKDAIEELDSIRSQFDGQSDFIATLIETSKAEALNESSTEFEGQLNKALKEQADKLEAEKIEAIAAANDELSIYEKKLKLSEDNLSSQLNDHEKLASDINEKEEKASRLKAHYDKTVQELQSSLDEQKTVRASIEDQLDNTVASLSEKENQLNSLKRNLQDAKNAINKSVETEEVLKTKILEQASSAAEFLEKLNSLKKELTETQLAKDNIESQFNGKSLELRDIHASLSTKDAHIKDLMNKLDSVTSQLIESRALRGNLEGQLTDLRLESEGLKGELRASQTSLKSYDDLIRVNLSKEKDILSKFEKEQRRFEKLSFELNLKEKALAEAHKNSVDRQVRFEELKVLILQREGELSQLQATLDQKGRDYSNLNQELYETKKILIKDKSYLEGEIKRLVVSLKTVERKVLDSRKAEENLQNSLKSQKKDYGKAVLQIRERDQMLKSQRSTIRDLQKQNWRYQDRLSLANDQLQDLLRSSSWKVTRPIRVIKRLITGQPPRPNPAGNSHATRVPPVSDSKTSKLLTKSNASVVNQENLSDKQIIANSTEFDASYYLASYPEVQTSGKAPIDHFLEEGWRKGYQPNEAFNTKAYIAAHPELKNKDVNPFVDYLRRLHSESYGKAYKGALADMERTGKIAVFGAISGGYDTLKEPLVQTPGADYFMFSDQDIEPGSLWKQRPFDFISSDPTRTARFIKTHPHLYFPDYDWAIWVDANLQINGDLRTFIVPHLDKADLITWHHPLRDCVYEEASECIKRNKDSDGTITEQIRRYEKMGLNRQSGLWETSVFVSKMKDPSVVGFMNNWWAEILQGSRRDQIGLPMALKKSDMKIAGLAPRGICMRSDMRFNYYRHTLRS